MLRTLEERDIRFVRLWFTDVLGYLKSVAIAPAELEGAFEEGIGFDDGSAIEGFSRGLRGGHGRQAGCLDLPDPAVGTQRTAPSIRRACSVTSRCPTGTRPGPIRGTCCAASWRRPATSASRATCTPRSSSSCWRTGRSTAARRSRGQRRLLRPGRARSGTELPSPRDRRARVDGHLGGVQPPRGRAGPAGDRPALRRRALDGRQRDDVPVRRQGGRHRRGCAGVVHAQAFRRSGRFGDAHDT